MADESETDDGNRFEDLGINECESLEMTPSQRIIHRRSFENDAANYDTKSVSTTKRRDGKDVLITTIETSASALAGESLSISRYKLSG